MVFDQVHGPGKQEDAQCQQHALQQMHNGFISGFILALNATVFLLKFTAIS
jgi:hypothetical protein